MAGDDNSAIGRLLDGISREGNARGYRGGGRGRENVLITEVFGALDFLPRTAFLGAVLRAAEGAGAAREAFAAEIEDASVQVLPGDIKRTLPGGRSVSGAVQPDVLIETRAGACLVEAKGIKGGTFPQDQIARNLLALQDTRHRRAGLLLLVLGPRPPIAVDHRGRLSIADAALVGLDSLGSKVDRDHFKSLAETSVAWITWAQIGEVTVKAERSSRIRDRSVNASVSRLAASIPKAIDRHK